MFIQEAQALRVYIWWGKPTPKASQQQTSGMRCLRQASPWHTQCHLEAWPRHLNAREGHCRLQEDSPEQCIGCRKTALNSAVPVSASSTRPSTHALTVAMSPPCKGCQPEGWPLTCCCAGHLLGLHAPMQQMHLTPRHWGVIASSGRPPASHPMLVLCGAGHRCQHSMRQPRQGHKPPAGSRGSTHQLVAGGAPD